MTKTKTVAQGLIEALELEGVQSVYGMPGSHILSAYDALSESSIKYIGAMHESTSAFMAGMHGYLTGRPGVCLLTAGPAATNSITAIAAAMASSLPVIHISADVPLKATNEAFHGTDNPHFLHHMFKDITKWSVRVETPESIYPIVSKAFKLACSGRPGPVHIDIPIDLLSSTIEGGHSYEPSHIKAIDERQGINLSPIVEKLSSAKNPMLCVGRGILVQGGELELLELAEKLNSPVLTTAYGLGAFDQNHPLSVGTFSEFSDNKFAFNLLEQSDYILAIGMRPNTLMMNILSKHSQQNFDLIALNETASNSNSYGIYTENCSFALKEILSQLSKQPNITRNKHIPNTIKTQRDHLNEGLKLEINNSCNNAPIHFGYAISQLKKYLNKDSIVTSGVGNHHVWSRTILDVRNRSSFIAEAAWGTMGGELGGAISAKITYPERQVLAITGDASLLMLAGDFSTAVWEKANIIVVVLNDSGHGIIGQMQKGIYGRSYGDKLPHVNFAQLASSLGGVGIRVEDPKDLDHSISNAFDASISSPVILDIVCESNILWPKRDELITKGKAALERSEAIEELSN